MSDRGTRSNGSQSQRALAEDLRTRIMAFPDVEERPLRLRHGMVPRAYWVGGMEFVHFHGDAQIDVRIPDQDLRKRVLRDRRAKVNPYARSRIEFDFLSPEDAAAAFRVVERVRRLLSQGR